MLTTLFALVAAGLDDWPSWRGPNRDGLSAEKELPTSWGPASSVLWKLPLPAAAGSTPVVVGDRIFLTSPSADGRKLLLLCAGTDGRLLWERTVSDGLKDAKNVASASPTADAENVWAYSGNGDLACFTREGAEVWRANLQERHGRFRLGFGMTTTPLVHGGVVYVQLIHSGGAWVVALEALSGRELWAWKRASDGVDECEHAYASIQFGGGTLISHGNDYTVGHDPRDGTEVWRLGDLNPKEKYNKTLRFVSSPLVTSELIVVPTAKNGAVVALDPAVKGRVDRQNAAHQRWRLDSGTPDVACPLLYDGLIYLSQNNGALTCLDAATGATVYKERPDKDQHFASPVAGDGKIYLTGRGGTVSVVAAGRAFKVLAVNELKDPMDASPAISGGRIYLRGTAHLWAIGSR
jgi:outer membrane protein assembly factor BamB